MAMLKTLVFITFITLAGGGPTPQSVPQHQIEEKEEWWTPTMAQSILAFGAAIVPCAYGLWRWRKYRKYGPKTNTR